MGIQDRDYYRNEGPSIFDSLMPSGVVCRWLIIVNIAVFIVQMVAMSTVRPLIIPGPDGIQIPLPNPSSGWVTDWFILDVSKVLDGQVWRLLTYAFLHSPDSYFMHLIFNMLFLWWFGSDIEQLYGRKEFLAIYLLSAFVGGIAFVVCRLALGSVVPENVMPMPIPAELNLPTSPRCMGASGAVTTMLILCALHFPRRTVLMFMVFPVPIWLLAVFNVAKDAYYLMHEIQGHGSSGVAVDVHLAGAVFAVAYYKWQGSITEVLGSLMWWRHRRPARPHLSLFEPDEEETVAVTIKARPRQVAADEHLEAKLDAVLEKIAEKGKESLTEKEQEILILAAEMYKRRRI
jgi:membrane associated rhomboid family serine protease